MIVFVGLLLVLLGLPGSQGWTDYFSMWCTHGYRSSKLGLATSGEKCKNMCLQNNPQCKAVEWWQGSSWCYECYDPSKRASYNSIGDPWYPPHVIVKPNQGWTYYSPMNCAVTSTILGLAKSGDDCKNMCLQNNPQCKAAVWWEGYDGCFECYDPSTRHPYTNTASYQYPPHVIVKPNQGATIPITTPTTPVSTTPGNIGWTKYSLMACGNRSPHLGRTKSGDDCKDMCQQNNPQCKAVEWWEGDQDCYECYDPSTRHPYTNTADLGFPPHVIVKPKQVVTTTAPSTPVTTTPGNIGWIHYSLMACGATSSLLGRTKSGDDCKDMCQQSNPQCKAVEWWEGDQDCYECYDPSTRFPYTNTADLGFPPHVLVKPNQGWIKYSLMACTLSYRSPQLGTATSVENCKDLCLQRNPQCKAAEWWEKYDQACFECYDPSKRQPYTNTADLAYPPHVIVKPNQGWPKYSPMWCTLSYRSPLLGTTTSVENCKDLCLQTNPQCKAAEWWEQDQDCYECYDPSERIPYTNTADLGYPPHVIVKPNSRLLFNDDLPVARSDHEGLKDLNTQEQLSDTQDKKGNDRHEATTHARKSRGVSQPIKDGVPVSLSHEKQEKKLGTAFKAMKKLREKRGEFASLIKKTANTE